MTFGDAPGSIRWKLHLRSRPGIVYRALATDEGRATFWAERTVEEADGRIHFHFAGFPVSTGRILRREPPRLIAVEYFGSVATFALEDDGAGGTELLLLAEGVPEADRVEVTAGWVSVLLALKAAVDFGVDLRNHDPARSWSDGYADN